MYSSFVFCHSEDGDMIGRNMKEDTAYKTVSNRFMYAFGTRTIII